MFDQLRDSLRHLSSILAPEERQRAASGMREAMIHAKLGLQDLRDALRTTEGRIATERKELETVQRRLGFARQVNDEETVRVGERFEKQHADRLAMLETKLMSQQQELTVTERELEEMSQQFRRAMSGIAPVGHDPESEAQREVDALLNDDLSGGQSSGAVPGLDTAFPRRTRAEREADAEDKLAALKRRMGK